MRHILVYAYQLSPFMGSEYGLAWDYVVNMSKTNRLTVLFGTSSGYHYLGNTSLLEQYVQSHPINNVTLVPVKPSFSFKVQDYSMIGVLRFYKQYKQYQDDVYRVALSICDREEIDLIHFLGPIGYREPGILWKLGKPYIWGPVGGVILYNKNVTIKGSHNMYLAFSAWIKAVFNEWTLLTDKQIKESVRRSDIVLGCTRETTLRLRKVFGFASGKIGYLTQNCMKDEYPLNGTKFSSKTLHVVWIGTIDNRKSLITALRVLSLVPNKSQLVFHVIGDGQLRKKCEQYVRENQLKDCVFFHGQMKREEVFDYFNSAHLFFLTSLLDVNPTVVWEAMSYCVPTLSWAFNGLEDIITPETGFLVPVKTYTQAVRDMARILQDVIDHPDILKEKAENIQRGRHKFSWAERQKTLNNLYDEAIALHGNSSEIIHIR